MDNIRGIVYCYTNKINNKIYIGETIREEGRKKEHKRFKSNKPNIYFYNSVKKYGWENFDYSILYETFGETKDIVNKEIKKKEVELIKKLGARVWGYNMTDGGDGAVGHITSEETKQKLSKAFSGEKHPLWGKQCKHAKPILKINLEGEILKEFRCVKDAALDVNVINASISNCCKKKKFKIKGFVYRFKNEYDLEEEKELKIQLIKRNNTIAHKYKADKYIKTEELFNRGLRMCSKCNKELPLDNFTLDKNNIFKLKSYCKLCSRIYQQLNDKNKKQVSAIPR